MAKREKYVVISGRPAWFESPYNVTTYGNIDAALNAYKAEKERVGDNVRLARIVLDYGEEI